MNLKPTSTGFTTTFAEVAADMRDAIGCSDSHIEQHAFITRVAEGVERIAWRMHQIEMAANGYRAPDE